MTGLQKLTATEVETLTAAGGQDIDCNGTGTQNELHGVVNNTLRGGGVNIRDGRR